MLKWPTFTMLTRFFAIISPTESTTANVWAISHHFTTEWLHKFQISHNAMTLSEGQGYSHWYQNVDYSHVSLRTKFEKNQVITIPMQANIKYILYWNYLSRFLSLENASCTKINNNKKFSMSLNKLTGCGSTPNFMQINWEICKQTSFCFLIQLWPWMKAKLNQTWTKLYNVVVSITIASLKKKWFTNFQMQANVNPSPFPHASQRYRFCLRVFLNTKLPRMGSSSLNIDLVIKRVQASSDQQVSMHTKSIQIYYVW